MFLCCHPWPWSRHERDPGKEARRTTEEAMKFPVLNNARNNRCQCPIGMMRFLAGALGSPFRAAVTTQLQAKMAKSHLQWPRRPPLSGRTLPSVRMWAVWVARAFALLLGMPWLCHMVSLVVSLLRSCRQLLWFLCRWARWWLSGMPHHHGCCCWVHLFGWRGFAEHVCSYESAMSAATLRTLRVTSHARLDWCGELSGALLRSIYAGNNRLGWGQNLYNPSEALRRSTLQGICISWSYIVWGKANIFEVTRVIINKNLRIF